MLRLIEDLFLLIMVPVFIMILTASVAIGIYVAVIAIPASLLLMWYDRSSNRFCQAVLFVFSLPIFIVGALALLISGLYLLAMLPLFAPMMYGYKKVEAASLSA
ncbi:MAG: hypothetical protein ACOZBH_04870 [Patescibacteria group bacterium]